MYIWILAIICFGFFAAIGFFKGAIRMTVSLIGFFVALMLAAPLSPMAKPLVPLLKVENPLLQPIVPPVIVFFVVEAIFVGLAFWIHHIVAKQIKYKSDEFGYNRWERLNKRTGIPIGLVAGSAHFVLVSLIIYVAGYLTTQVSTEENSSGTLSFLNKARTDMQTTGLDKLVAPMDPAKPIYYQVSDLLGLIYHNPVLTGRLSTYPAYLPLEDSAEFQAIGSDTEYMQMIQTKSELGTVINNPKTQAILANQALLDTITGVDLKDLRTYLETGKSPKYDENKILGRWRLDVNALLRQLKKKKADITAAELGMVKRVATTALTGVTLRASPDNKIVVKAPAAPAPEPTTDATAAAPAPAAALDPRYRVAQQQQPRLGAGGPTSIAANLRQRLGQAPPPAPRNLPPGAPGAPARPAAPPIDLKLAAPAGEGTWSGESDKFDVTMPGPGGKPVQMKGTFDNERLLLTGMQVDLVFERIR